MSEGGATAITWARYEQVVVLTGAGVSVASGLPTYRGKGGLWRKVETARLADANSVFERPHDVWAFFSKARKQIDKAKPNAAHLALAEVERRVRAAGHEFLLITQNIDGLHQRAGSEQVVELHGSVARARCSDPGCDLEPFDLAGGEKGKRAPACPRCTAPLRPDVVLFGEMLPVEAEWRAKKALDRCDLFLAAGTSGTVYPAANFVRSAEYAGARTIFLNLDEMDPPNAAFGEILLGRAELLLPKLVSQNKPL